MITPPITTVAKGRCISAPSLVERAIGKNPKTRDERRHQNGTQANEGRLVAGRQRILPRFAGMFGRADPDQAVQDGHSKQGDESNAGRNAEGHSAKGKREHAARGRHGNGQEDQQGEPSRSERRVQAVERSPSGRSA